MLNVIRNAEHLMLKVVLPAYSPCTPAFALNNPNAEHSMLIHQGREKARYKFGHTFPAL